MIALDQLDKFRLDLARHELANAPVLIDIGPFADQIEIVQAGSLATQDAALTWARERRNGLLSPKSNLLNSSTNSSPQPGFTRKS